ncbi:MAG: hypothetical protein U5J64_03040 [Halobacteriales archaeon]|nr:hypothetical protein [Halobacteriales archaeon]
MKGDSDEHPLYNLVGILDDEEAERVRERVKEFRDGVSEEIDSFRSG